MPENLLAPEVPDVLEAQQSMEQLGGDAPDQSQGGDSFDRPAITPAAPEPETPVGSVFDAMDRVAANPPTPEDMADLITETDRIDKMLQDDPAPVIEFLGLPDEDIIATFRGRLQEAAAFRAPMEKLWLKAFSDYNQKIDPEAAVWRSKIKIPYVRALALSAIPPGIAAAFDGDKILSIEPLRPEHEKKAESMEALIQWQLTTRIPARKSFRHFLHYRALYGTGIARTGWRHKKKPVMSTIPVYDDQDDLGRPLPPDQHGAFLGTKRGLSIQTVMDDPELEAVDLWSAFPCPWTSLRGIPYFIESATPTRDELLAMARSGELGHEAAMGDHGKPMTPEEAINAWFKENPTFSIEEGSTEFSLGTRASALRVIGLQSPHSGGPAAASENDPGPGACPIFWYSTEDVRICFAGDGSGRILGKQGNPFDHGRLPYHISQYEEIVPGYVWGGGIGMAAGPIQTQIDFDINHANDGRRLTQNPVFKRKQLGSALLGDIAIHPGAVIPVREMDDLEQLELQDKSGATIEWTGMLVGFGDRAVGIGDMQRGLADAGVDTATEADIVDSNAATRLLAQVWEIKDTWDAIGRDMVALNKQFFDKERMIRVSGADGLAWFQTITPEDILGDFDVTSNASLSRSSRATQTRNMLTLYPLANQDPMFNQRELRRRMLKALGQDRIDDLLMPLPTAPMDPMDEEMLLKFGLATPVSPDDDDIAHLQVHEMATMALQSMPAKDPGAISAHLKHMDDHRKSMALKQQQLMMGAAQMAGGGGAPPEKPGGGGGPVRENATALGKAQGSHGQAGNAPGPQGVPGRPMKGAA